ncbi:hypothetical protein Tco_1108219 [Tanacetum coccineum]
MRCLHQSTFPRFFPATSPFLCIDSSEAPDSSDGPPSQDPFGATLLVWRNRIIHSSHSSSSADSSPDHLLGFRCTIRSAHSGSSTRSMYTKIVFHSENNKSGDSSEDTFYFSSHSCWYIFVLRFYISSKASVEEDAKIGPTEAGVDMELGSGDGDDVRDHVEIDRRDVRDDTEEYEADASASLRLRLILDPSQQRCMSVRSVEDMPVDLDDAVRDFYHHMSEVRIDRIVGIESAQRRLCYVGYVRDRGVALRLQYVPFHQDEVSSEFVGDCDVARGVDLGVLKDTEGVVGWSDKVECEGRSGDCVPLQLTCHGCSAREFEFQIDGLPESWDLCRGLNKGHSRVVFGWGGLPNNIQGNGITKQGRLDTNYGKQSWANNTHIRQNTGATNVARDYVAREVRWCISRGSGDLFSVFVVEPKELQEKIVPNSKNQNRFGDKEEAFPDARRQRYARGGEDLGSFDVIIGMDWLAKNHAVIVCDEKIVRIPYGNEILIVQGDKGCQGGKKSKLRILSCEKGPSIWRKWQGSGCTEESLGSGYHTTQSIRDEGYNSWTRIDSEGINVDLRKIDVKSKDGESPKINRKIGVNAGDSKLMLLGITYN